MSTNCNSSSATMSISWRQNRSLNGSSKSMKRRRRLLAVTTLLSPAAAQTTVSATTWAASTNAAQTTVAASTPAATEAVSATSWSANTQTTAGATSVAASATTWAASTNAAQTSGAASTPAAAASATTWSANTPAAAQTTTASEPEHTCPPELNGWAPSPDCTKYYWCNAGNLASMAYDCVEDTLFDAVQLTCLPAADVICETPTTSTSTVTTTESYTWTESPTAFVSDAPTPAKGTASPAIETSGAGGGKKKRKTRAPTTSRPTKSPTTSSPTETPTTRSPTVHPTPRETYIGDAIYYPDFPSRSCQTQNAPQWLTPEELFTTKAECCEKVMSWIPLEDCLGANWTETNYYFTPTESPTLRPSHGPSLGPSEEPTYMPTENPTVIPTFAPSSSEPTAVPSLTPTQSPNGAPTHFPSSSPTLSPTEFESSSPTLTPTTESPTPAPTVDQKIVMAAKLETASQVQESYLVDLIGWANEGMETYSTQAFSNTFSTEVPGTTTHSSILQYDSQVSELMLPVSDDATVSRQRPNLNFGDHQALAVDGGDPTSTVGDSDGETFDSLLKFDVSLIDSSRAVESLVLKLYVVEGCKSGGTFTTTSNTSWESSTITWDSAPMADGEWLASLSTLPASEWIEVDITKALSWHDAASAFVDPYISIRIESGENSRCLYSSMESGDALSPRMVVKYMEQTVIEMSETHQGDDVKPLLPPPVIGDFLLLKATDDATVVGSKPSSNFGNEPNLLMAFDSQTRDIFDSLIRFDLTELVSTPARTAVLSLYSETECVSAGMFTTTSSDSEWDEDTVNWGNAPMYEPGTQSGTSLGVFGAVEANKWNAFNVLPAINDAVKQGKSALTFRISSGNLNPCQFTSRNGGRAPKLMIAF